MHIHMRRDRGLTGYNVARIAQVSKTWALEGCVSVISVWASGKYIMIILDSSSAFLLQSEWGWESRVWHEIVGQLGFGFRV